MECLVGRQCLRGGGGFSIQHVYHRKHTLHFVFFCVTLTWTDLHQEKCTKNYRKNRVSTTMCPAGSSHLLCVNSHSRHKAVSWMNAIIFHSCRASACSSLRDTLSLRQCSGRDKCLCMFYFCQFKRRESLFIITSGQPHCGERRQKPCTEMPMSQVNLSSPLKTCTVVCSGGPNSCIIKDKGSHSE